MTNISKNLSKILVLTFITQQIFTAVQETVTVGSECKAGTVKFIGVKLIKDSNNNNNFEEFQKCINEENVLDKKKKAAIFSEIKMEVKNDNHYCFLKISPELEETYPVNSIAISETDSNCLNENVFQNANKEDLTCPENSTLIYFSLKGYPCIPNNLITLQILFDHARKNQCTGQVKFYELDFYVKLHKFVCYNNQIFKTITCNRLNTCSSPEMSCYFNELVTKNQCYIKNSAITQSSKLTLAEPLKIVMYQNSPFQLYLSFQIEEASQEIRDQNPGFDDTDFYLEDSEINQYFKEVMVNIKSGKIMPCSEGFRIYFIKYAGLEGCFCLDHAYAGGASENKKSIYGVDYNLNQLQTFFDNYKEGEFIPKTSEEAQAYYYEKRAMLI